MSVTSVRTCKQCERLFLARPMLQAAARHLAAREGPRRAGQWVEQELAEEHAQHEAAS